MNKFFSPMLCMAFSAYFSLSAANFTKPSEPVTTKAFANKVNQKPTPKSPIRPGNAQKKITHQIPFKRKNNVKAFSSSDNDTKCHCHPSLDQQIPVFANIVALKILNNIPLSVADFPAGGVQSLTDEQKEAFRQAESDALRCCLGKHAGWKLGLASATPSTPSLGYTAPVYGELLEKMILVGNSASIPSNYGLSADIEADMLFVVGSSDINNATTPAELLLSIKGVYPAIEMAAIGTTTVNEASGPLAPPVVGQLNGQGILQVTNIAARMFLRTADCIKIHNSSRSLAEWETILNGGLSANDTLVLTTGPSITGSVPPPAVPHLTNLLNLINLLNANGHYLKKGDLVSPGTAIGLRILSTTNLPLSYSVTYNNIDPKGPVTMNLLFNENGKCYGKNQCNTCH
ncbi:MAG: hypothetical protein LLF94_10825 [Chlamydiales bacterium]|nr:hypothetical protein [Chlamydiales bacterium]